MSLIVSLKLKDNINIEIYQGSMGKYYCINENSNNLFAINIYYDIHFPLEWALFKHTFLIYGESYNTGPHFCNNCKYFGYHNGVFIGYCMNCASAFNYKRGNGMTDLYKEVDENMIAFDLSNLKKENSMWNTYLKDVNLSEIGDNKLKEDYELYKDLPDLIPIEESEDDYELNDFYDYDDKDDEKIKLKIDKLMDNRKFDRY